MYVRPSEKNWNNWCFELQRLKFDASMLLLSKKEFGQTFKLLAQVRAIQAMQGIAKLLKTKKEKWVPSPRKAFLK